MKEKFENRFLKSCSKYPFYHQHINTLENPRIDYVNYVFDDGGNGGGLGDRLGGIITAYAFALRTNRSFYITSLDKSFYESFRPYYSQSTLSIDQNEYEYTWKNLSWLHYTDMNVDTNSTYHSCVNPRASSTQCALDHNEPVRQIKYKGNRSYLCRWAYRDKPTVNLKELHRTLGITTSYSEHYTSNGSSVTDLYEVAGCLLRLVLWPTEDLWLALDETVSEQSEFAASLRSLDSHFTPDRVDGNNSATSTSTEHSADFQSNSNREDAVPSSSSPYSYYQIGYHFRCGDSSFNTANVHINKQCVRNDEAYEWQGTNFGDDCTVESPVDLATCGLALLRAMNSRNSSLHENAGNSSAYAHHRRSAALGAHHPINNNNRLTVMYIASDYYPSSQQIYEQLAPYPYILRFPSACHVDIQRSEMCALSTYVHWLMLALSDKFVLQGAREAMQTSYLDREVRNTDGSKYVKELPPISAFSRYAAIYSLAKDALRYGSKCEHIDTRKLAQQSQGNWVCNPIMFYK
ncbi:unnamed protein product [Sphagnum balticum]